MLNQSITETYRVVLTLPEIASVGLTEKQAKEKDTIKLVNSVLSFRKAKASGTQTVL
jgi:pyruvate/2-oxoglutarate dehydrogenase complex dihydrolipoamide dehydrogenase (E3) component